MRQYCSSLGVNLKKQILPFKKMVCLSFSFQVCPQFSLKGTCRKAAPKPVSKAKENTDYMKCIACAVTPVASAPCDSNLACSICFPFEINLQFSLHPK